MHYIYNKFTGFLSIGLVLCLGGCVASQSQKTQIGACEFVIEEARTTEERSQGLMYRDSLAKDTGMLFFLGRDLTPESAGGFHMRNVNFDLDLVFLSQEKQITDIQTVPKCESEHCPIYRPKSPSYYVLEINAKQAEACALKVGDFLNF